MKKLIMGILSMMILSCSGSDHSEWVWNIEGEKITQNDLNAAYKGYLFMMKEQMQQATRSALSDEEFMKYIENPELIENPQLRAMFLQLSKKAFVEQYQMILMLKMEAEKTKFLEKPDVKNKLEFMHNYFLSNLYLMDKINPESIKVSDDESLEMWDKIRQSDRRYAAVPILEGQKMAQQRIMMRKMMEMNARINQQIRDKYKIETNDSALEALISEKSVKKQTETKPEAPKEENSKDAPVKEAPPQK